VAAIRAIGRPGFRGRRYCSTAATILYLNAFRRTSVADVAVIFAAAPFFTAGLGLAMSRPEGSVGHARRQSFALLGVGIMVNGAITDGASDR